MRRLNCYDLSSDSGLLLIKEFAAKVGLIKLVNKLFKTNAPASHRVHLDADNLMQLLYQIDVRMRDIAYSIKAPVHMLFDIDFTLIIPEKMFACYRDTIPFFR